MPTPKYSKAKEKEDRILRVMSEHPEGLTPSTLSGIIIDIKYKTIKSILRRLERKGIVKNNNGYYSIVQNNTHALFSYNFQNVVMQVETPKIIVGNRICEDNSLDEIIKFRMEIGVGGGRKLKEDFGMVLDIEKINHNGSGIALGHPVGSTGLRIIVTMYYEMERLGLTVGGASLCVGGGPAMASLWTRDI